MYNITLHNRLVRRVYPRSGTRTAFTEGERGEVLAEAPRRFRPGKAALLQRTVVLHTLPVRWIVLVENEYNPRFRPQEDWF